MLYGINRRLAPAVLAQAIWWEQELRRELKMGTRQILLLGAGLDSLPYRQTGEMEKAKYYEVDMPEMIAYKELQLKKAKITMPENVYRVGADLAENWIEPLLWQTPFAPEERSLTVMLGVAYYLPQKALDKLLAQLANITPQGSTLLFDCQLTDLGKNSETDTRQQEPAAVAEKVMTDGMSMAELTLMLERHGYLIYEDMDEATYNALVETAKSVPGCTLFDAQTDGNHNRCVFTLIGSPEAIEEVAFQLTKVATERIDMNKHHGEHKRMGATDVIPFVPQMDVTVEEAVEMSKRVAQRIWDELKVPSFLYEDSATRPERRNLATCRKGEFEGMPEKLLQPDWAPDYGERKIHPTAGITAIGARMPLVAFNCNLETSDVEIAKKIAKVIRGSSGGFRSCKAMGFMLEDRGIAQVSMNMVNYEDTPLYVTYEMIKALAERYGTRVIESEIVGLTPAKALIDCAEFYLKAKDFDCKKQVMEYHLIDME